MDPATTTAIFTTMVRDSKIRVSDAIWHAGRKSPQHHQGKQDQAGDPHQIPPPTAPGWWPQRLYEGQADTRAQKEDRRRLRTSSFTGRPVSRAPTATPAGIVTIPQTLPCINREVSSLRDDRQGNGQGKGDQAPRQEDTMTPE